MVNENLCPVCGYGMEDPPCDYNICPCCGTEFGNHDLNASIASLRNVWLRNGAKWWSSLDPPPVGWDPYEQLNALIERPKYSGGFVFLGDGLQQMISGPTQAITGITGIDIPPQQTSPGPSEHTPVKAA